MCFGCNKKTVTCFTVACFTDLTAATRSGQCGTRFTVACLQISLDVNSCNKKWTLCDPFQCGVLTDLLPWCVRPQQEVDSLWRVSVWRADRSSPLVCSAATRSGHFVTRFSVACWQIFSLGVFGRNKKWTLCDAFHCGLLTDLLPRCVRPQQEAPQHRPAVQTAAGGGGPVTVSRVSAWPVDHPGQRHLGGSVCWPRQRWADDAGYLRWRWWGWQGRGVDYSRWRQLGGGGGASGGVDYSRRSQ